MGVASAENFLTARQVRSHCHSNSRWDWVDADHHERNQRPQVTGARDLPALKARVEAIYNYNASLP